MARRIPQKPFAPTKGQRGRRGRLVGDGPELTLVDKAGLPGSWWAVDDEGNHFRVHPKRGGLGAIPAGDTGLGGIEATRKLVGAGVLWVSAQLLHQTGCGSLERTTRVFGVRVGTPATDDDVCAAGGAWLREKWQAERTAEWRRLEVRACQCVVSLFDPSDTPKSTRLRPEVSGV